MADDIKQTLGFDVSQALDALAKLDGAFQSFEGRLRSVADTLKGFNSNSAKTAAALGNLGNTSASTSASVSASTAKMASAFQSSSAQSIAHVDRLTTSVKLLSRIVFTQAVIKSLRVLETAFQSTAESAIGFQKEIALISTIDDSHQSLDQLSNSVRKLSDQYNIPLLETAKGLYQTLGNQVGDTADSLAFLSEAMQFSKATGSDLVASVDLLSATLKSYNLDVQDTNKVSSEFFKVIDLSRASAEQLGNKMGQLEPIASALGVSLEELGAAVAAISVKGNNTPETLTQLKGILTGLLKPSKDMKAALSEMGFSSAEAAIQTLGLSGVLDELNRRTGGSSTELARLFSNVRALSGATSLTSDDLKALTANIEEMTATGRNFNREKFLQATATDAERVTAEINRLHNALVTGLGQQLLSGTNKLFQFAGGAEAVTKALEGSLSKIGSVAAALVLLQGRFIASRNGALGLAKSFDVLALAVTAFAAGSAVGDVIEGKRSKNALAPVEQLAKANAEGLDKYKAQLLDAQDADNKASKVRLQNAQRMVQELNKSYLQQNKDVEEAQKTLKRLQAKADQRTPEQIRQGKSNLTQQEDFQLKMARIIVQTAPNPLAKVQNIDKLSAITGKQINTPDELSRGLTEAEKKAEDLRAKLTQALAVKPQAGNLLSEINRVFDEIDKRAGARNSVGSATADALRSQFDNLVQLFKEVNKDGKVTEDELNVLNNLGKQFSENAFGGGLLSADRINQRLGFSSSVELLGQAFEKMQALSKLPTENIGAIQTELQSIEGVLLLFQPASNAMKEGEQASANIASNYQRAATAAERLNTIQVSPVSRALGGSIPWEHFASGGAARGTDTIPAMLSAGEFVVNSRQSAKFLPQLQAINAGIQPSFNNSTSATTNISVGDIVVEGGGNPDIAARKVMEAIRREKRRGTGRI